MNAGGGRKSHVPGAAVCPLPWGRAWKGTGLQDTGAGKLHRSLRGAPFAGKTVLCVFERVTFRWKKSKQASAGQTASQLQDGSQSRSQPTAVSQKCCWQAGGGEAGSSATVSLWPRTPSSTPSASDKIRLEQGRQGAESTQDAGPGRLLHGHPLQRWASATRRVHV